MRVSQTLRAPSSCSSDSTPFIRVIKEVTESFYSHTWLYKNFYELRTQLQLLTCYNYIINTFIVFAGLISQQPPAAMVLRSSTVFLLLLCFYHSGSAIVVADNDYGGVPLWVDRLLGEPSVLSLQGRLDSAWFRANNPQTCPQQCDCPIQWPTALYCDHRGLAEIPQTLPNRTEYLFLQVRKHTDRHKTCTGLEVEEKNVFFLRTTTLHLCLLPCWPTILGCAGWSWTTTSWGAESWLQQPCSSSPNSATFLRTITTWRQCPEGYQLDSGSCDWPTTKSAASVLGLLKTCTTWPCCCCRETGWKPSKKKNSSVTHSCHPPYWCTDALGCTWCLMWRSFTVSYRIGQFESIASWRELVLLCAQPPAVLGPAALPVQQLPV